MKIKQLAPLLLLSLALLPHQDAPVLELPEDPNLHLQEPQAAQSSPEHRRLAEEVGTWTATVHLYFSPGMSPIEASGLFTSKLIGDQWLTSHFVCKALGTDLSFHRTVGYDKQRGKALGMLVSADSLNISELIGSYDMDRRERTLQFEATDVLNETRSFKSKEKTIDAENRTYALFEVKEGNQEIPVLQMDLKLIGR
jgi:hypothetical protein